MEPILPVTVCRAPGATVVATRAALVAAFPASLAAMDEVVFDDMDDFGVDVWVAAFQAAARAVAGMGAIAITRADLCENVRGMRVSLRLADWVVDRCVRHAASDAALRSAVVDAVEDMGYTVTVEPTSLSWLRVTRPGRDHAAFDEWCVHADRTDPWHRALTAAMAFVDGQNHFAHGEMERRAVREAMRDHTLVALLPSPLLLRRP